MSDNTNDVGPLEGKWDFVEESSLVVSENEDKKSIEKVYTPEETSIELAKSRTGILTKIKMGKLKDKAQFSELEMKMNAHLDATKHALHKALEVQKKRIDLVAQKYLYQITEEHLRDMREMGIKNYESSMSTLLVLNQETSKLLVEAEKQDVPTIIKKKTVDAIMEKWDKFFNDIKSENM